MHQDTSSQAGEDPSAISQQPIITPPTTVLAIASAGGHWVQLRRLHPAFSGTRLIYATTRETYRNEVETHGAEFKVVPDCNRWQKIKLIKSAISITWLIISKKPDVIISTGAAPGYFAVRLGKLLGKKTVWIDSIANAEELSLSGMKAGGHVDHWFTQWEHLAKQKGPIFFGNVLGDEKETESNSQSKQTLLNATNIDDNVEPPRIPNKLRIFVTVGTDLPFDRLVLTIDNWAPSHPEYEIFAQIGETEYKPKNIEFSRFIEPPDFKKRFQEADYIISHAGMGTILSSLNYQKPLLIMPRIAAKGEHRNEHQLATAKHLLELNKVNVAKDEYELLNMLDSLQEMPTKGRIGANASSTLTNRIKEIISKS